MDYWRMQFSKYMHGLICIFGNNFPSMHGLTWGDLHFKFVSRVVAICLNPIQNVTKM